MLLKSILLEYVLNKEFSGSICTIGEYAIGVYAIGILYVEANKEYIHVYSYALLGFLIQKVRSKEKRNLRRFV